MGFTAGDDPKRIAKQNKKIAKRIFRETGQRVGFVTSRGGGGGRIISSPETRPGVLGVRGRGNDVTGIAQPISVPSVSGTKTRRELQLSEGKKGDLFCEIKIIKGKRKRVCKVKTTDKKRKKPIRVTRRVDKQFGFFRRIL